MLLAGSGIKFARAGAEVVAGIITKGERFKKCVKGFLIYK